MMNTEENTKRLEDILHGLRKHPDYEYAFTQCHRKGEDFERLDLEEKGWECFNHDRGDYIDTRTYRRLKRPAMTQNECIRLEREAAMEATIEASKNPHEDDWNTKYVSSLRRRGLKLVPGRIRVGDKDGYIAAPPAQSCIWMYEYPSTIVPTE